jgi:hypothetical protein
MTDLPFWTSSEPIRIFMRPSDRIVLLKALRRMFRNALANQQYRQARAAFNLASVLTPRVTPSNARDNDIPHRRFIPDYTCPRRPDLKAFRTWIEELEYVMHDPNFHAAIIWPTTPVTASTPVTTQTTPSK